jgi:hypothetical protein
VTVKDVKQLRREEKEITRSPVAIWSSWFPAGVDLCAWPCNNNFMRSLRGKFRIALASLTATTLLVAATPHFHCLCPNGQVKPFCLNVRSGPTGCCCGGACCTSNEDGSTCCQAPGDPVDEPYAEGPSCCQGATKQSRPNQAARPAATTAHVRSQCCTRTPQAEFIAVAPEPGSERPDHPIGDLHSLVAPPAPVLASGSLYAHGWPLSWQSHQLPPPTNLVIALEHFLI